MQKYKLINNYQVMENKIWVQREIKPTPVLEGQDVINFYKKLASFKDDVKKVRNYS